MKVEFDRYTIKLIPENEQDVAFIEDTVGLFKDGDSVSLERLNYDAEEMGFRLETDLPSIANPSKKFLPHPKYRPIEDLIDYSGSFDGPPYSRTHPGGTKKMDEYSNE